jgi:hypothetical protein
MFTPGEVLSATKLNELANQAGYGKQWHSSKSLVAQGSFGTVNLAGDQVLTAEIYDFPFKVTVGKEGNDVTVFVRPGSVNNFMPKIGSSYLDATPTPYLSFSTFTSTNTKIVVLKVTKDGVRFFPNTCQIILLDDYESLVDTDNYGYLALATISGQNSPQGPIVTSVSQLIYASQIVIRAKPGSETAIWSFSSR